MVLERILKRQFWKNFKLFEENFDEIKNQMFSQFCALSRFLQKTYLNDDKKLIYKSYVQNLVLNHQVKKLANHS